MHITLCAKSKIFSLLEDGKAFRIHSPSLSGSQVDLIPNSEVLPNDSTISCIPLIVADIQTILSMAGREIDFDYYSGDFIISI